MSYERDIPILRKTPQAVRFEVISDGSMARLESFDVDGRLVDWYLGPVDLIQCLLDDGGVGITIEKNILQTFAFPNRGH